MYSSLYAYMFAYTNEYYVEFNGVKNMNDTEVISIVGNTNFKLCQKQSNRNE